MNNIDTEKNSISEPKLIVVTIVGTLFVVGTLFYSFRVELLQYVFRALHSDIEAMIPQAVTYQSNEEQVISAIAAVNPAVVSVIVTKNVPIYEQYYETVDPWGLFGGFAVPRIRENGTEEREVGGGSGFIVSSDGLIVTNRHVVDDTEARYSVVLADGSVYDVEVIDRDPQIDIAVLKITSLPNSKLPTVHFGSSEELQLGQTVIAIGNALAEFQNTVSVGVVSGLSRSVVASDVMGNSEQLHQVIQTDAAINPGNSGGPLLDLQGRVIGVNVATSRDADNIGFALPAHVVEQIVDSVNKYGEIVRPFLGVRYLMIDETVREERGITQLYGALIVAGPNDVPAVAPDSPAAIAGLQLDDIIVAIDGVSLRNRDLATELRNRAVGDTVALTVLRNGVEQVVTVTLTSAL